tara:strand:+ start:2655 stop:3557 length:903 start_codon:yes stop_codon:yes gene_type:complete
MDINEHIIMKREKGKLTKTFQAIALMFFTCTTTVEAGPILAKDANTLAQHEAIGNALGLFGILAGADAGNELAWSGTVSDAGWTAQMLNESYRDGVLSMSYSGMLDIPSDIITWTGTLDYTNPFGSIGFTSNGSYTDALVDGDWLDAFAIVVIGGLTIAADVVVAGAQGVTTVGSVGTLGAPAIAASGTAITGITTAGVTGIVAIVNKKSDGKVKTTVNQPAVTKNSPYIAPFPINEFGLIKMEESPIYVVGNSLITGDYQNSQVDVTGSFIVSVPEPTTFILFGIGLLGLVGFSRDNKT